MKKLSLNRRRRAGAQRGVFLLEALVAILIFSLGILGMVAMGGVAIAAHGDAQYRTEAAAYAQEMAAEIALAMSSNGAANATTLPNFVHQPVSGGSCVFAGGASSDARVTAWVKRVTGETDAKKGLPGSTDVSQQINIDLTPGNHRKVTITLCWQPPRTAGLQDSPMNRYQYITYITPNDDLL